MSQSTSSREQIRQKVIDLVEAMPGIGWAAWPDGDFMCFSSAITAFSGNSVDFLSSKDANGDFAWKQSLEPEDYDVLSQAWRNAISQESVYEVTHKTRAASGEFRWVRSTGRPQRDEAGNIIYWLGTTIDIHDAMTAMEKSQANEQRLNDLIDALPGLVFTFAPDGEPTYFNKRLEKWSGIALSELSSGTGSLLSTVLAKAVHSEERPQVEAAIAQSLSTGAPFTARFRQYRADGVWRWVEARIEALRDQAGKIVQWYGLMLDIENEVRAQESHRDAYDKLTKAAQFAGVAELSASIAHELSQPLASVVLSSDACRRWLTMVPPKVDRALASAENTLRDANAASEVVKKIRALFLKNGGMKELSDINEIIITTSELFQKEMLTRRIRLSVEPAPHLPLLMLDRIQIQQVIANLIKNGADAAAEDEQDERAVMVRTSALRGEVLVEVSDTGRGIVDQEKIFNPFFTTKPHGMGMGLSISRSIIYAHGGRLWAQNNPRGASLWFALSASEVDRKDGGL
ncbi:PAS domain-containing sensor histidine kinase [Pararhizobium arenae]|uniref:PAS domain-containing sensor histidine kinase n=1 Tax=Pararhizobium arenae TaxID=1856850 RepID=UPI00094AD2F9|nr:PAS domain-containing protein [Pararhizobium arenae]